MKKLGGMLAAVAAVWAGTAAAATYDVTAAGAKADGVTDNTAAIQRTIDDCSAKGGGTVLVPGGGVYKTYTLNLKNNVELRIDRGATLKGGEDPYKYPEFVPTTVWHPERSPRFNKRAMFYTVGQTNVAITGHGTIDGNAEAFHHRENGRYVRNSHTNITGRCVFFVGCRDVRFDDILVYHPSGWSTWFLDCDRVSCRGVRIECNREYPNGDGLHFGGCRDVVVSDCVIDSQDDSLIIRCHQEQMNGPKPCERVLVENCTLRSNGACAIRIGWTGDGPVRDVRFNNIVSSYCRLGVQFKLPAMNPIGRENIDPPRGRGVVPPPKSELAPFSIENMHFSNMSLNCYDAPFFIDVGCTERCAFMRDISFANCRFTCQRPPVFHIRPEDHVSDWTFDDVEFAIRKPRGAVDGNAGPWFDNASGITFNNVRWTCLPKETPEWYMTVQQDGVNQPVVVRGALVPCTVDESEPGVRRYRYDQVIDGISIWKVAIELEERIVGGTTEWTGRLVNGDRGIRVTGFEGPYYAGVETVRGLSTLYVPDGLGRRVADFPRSDDPSLKPVPGESVRFVRSGWYRGRDARPVYATGFYPGSSGITMPWFAMDGEEDGVYAGSHDPVVQPKRILVRWDAPAHRSDLAFEHALSLRPGETFDLGKLDFSPYRGDWHEAAKKYRAWYDTVRTVGTAVPAWAKDVSGWLLVIMKQQNEALFWPYTDISKLCDVAEANGLNCIGLFGWTKGGHDHLYPDYEADPKMGGVEALKAGIAEAHRRGIRIFIYANGQLQHVGATKFWDEAGKDIALVMADGKMIIQNYHKYSDIPKYDFALGCLGTKPWHDRMLALADQAEGFGADGILYDQLGIFAPFSCHGKGHGHATPAYVYCDERPGFLRSIADKVQARNKNFAVLTEGLHDTILDSIALFHGCETGTYPDTLRSIAARAEGSRSGAFPELWHYTFPELVTTVRVPTPMATRTMANYTAAFGFRHDIELRYAPDRDWVLEGKVPTREGYGTVRDIPNTAWMQANDPKKAAAYLKAVNLFQRKYAQYLLKGRFADTEGFTAMPKNQVIAKRFVAADGTSAVLVWNLSAKAPATVTLAGLGEPTAVAEPEAAVVRADALLAPDTLRLYVFGR